MLVRHFTMAEKAIAQAADLKEQKDKLQLGIIEQGISLIWDKYDPENKGYLT